MKRRWTQLVAAVAANSYWPGFLQGHIYRGPPKAVCVPFLNCYSCPGAWASCPIGSLQSLAAGFGRTLSLYVIGLLTAIGALGGRWVCGWLCPFGLLQELLYAFKTKKGRLPRAIRCVPFVVLGFTVTLPLIWRDMVGMAEPYFCKYICPAGTLEAGLPLLLLRPQLRPLIGPTFIIKVAILLVLVVASIFIWRPFCQVLCPLGAFYGLFNKAGLWRLHVHQPACISCYACRHSCPAGLAPDREPNSPACVRCLECTRVCPTGALTFGSQTRTRPVTVKT